MPGGLIQHVQYGAQDVYLTGNINVDYIYMDVDDRRRFAQHGQVLHFGIDESNEHNESKWSSDAKPLDPDHSFCVFMQDAIPLGDSYGECAKCNACFTVEELKKYFAVKTGNPTCPVCRGAWTQWIEFVNAEKYGLKQ